MVWYEASKPSDSMPYDLGWELYGLRESLIDLKNTVPDLATWFTLSMEEKLVVSPHAILRRHLESALSQAERERLDCLHSLSPKSLGIPESFQEAREDHFGLIYRAYQALAEHRQSHGYNVKYPPDDSDIEYEWMQDSVWVDPSIEGHLTDYVVIEKIRHDSGFTELGGYSGYADDAGYSRTMSYVDRFIEADEMVRMLQDQLRNLEGLVTLLAIDQLVDHTDSTELQPTEGPQNSDPDTYGLPGLYPENWHQVARTIRARDGHQCVNCGDLDGKLHVHHIVPLSVGGTNRATNLITLCESCHASLHPHMRGYDQRQSWWRFWK